MEEQIDMSMSGLENLRLAVALRRLKDGKEALITVASVEPTEREHDQWRVPCPTRLVSN